MRHPGTSFITGVIMLITVGTLFLIGGCSWLGADATPEALGETPTPRPTAGASQPTPTSTRQIQVLPSSGPASSYLAVAPKVLRSGQTETISISLFDGQKPASGNVQVALLKDGRSVAEASGLIQGKGDLSLALPRLAEGDYQLRLTGGPHIQDQSPIRVEDGTLIFVETDKPIYKPGQPVHIRVVTLDPQLKPVSGAVQIDVTEAKGTKVFKQDVKTDEYGMASVEMPLSTEPNLGAWKISAQAGKRTAQADIRVERYVLPKYEVTVELPKDWILASDKISGVIKAQYSYGKPVRGEMQIRALRYVGTWQEFANITRSLDGEVGTWVDFQLPPVGYVSGVPGAKGLGNVSLEITVREKSTGYEEKTTRLLSVAATSTTLKVIPDSVTFKPGLPVSFLVVAETPDRKPVDANVQLAVIYTKDNNNTSQETRQVAVKGGKAIVKFTPPADAISLSLNATSDKAFTSLALQSGYSPSGSFIHLEQVSQGVLKVGDVARFKVTATKQATSFYYEVIARGMVVFSDVSPSPEINLPLAPMMAPNARLLVYQILPTSEVAADYIPFSVEGAYPQKVDVNFSQAEVKPGEDVTVNLQTEGAARVGLVAVDKSVFILAENRLNLQQVFDALERLYQQPQVELHEVNPLDKIRTRGAKEVFQDAGVIVLSNKQVPGGKEYDVARFRRDLLAKGPMVAPAAAGALPPMATNAAEAVKRESTHDAGLAEVQRVRQFFPETWIWTDLTTDASGKAAPHFTAPDSITTWMLRAVALSKQTGLGIAEAQLRVLQPFFVQADLPYSTIRGEEFPVKVALYNYLTSTEEFVVELEKGDWFELQDQPVQTITVGPNDIGSVSFTIRPHALGAQQIKITARSRSTADAIVKELIIEPEGVQREVVENLVLSPAEQNPVAPRQLDLSVPAGIIEGSARAYLAITGNFLTQTIKGLEQLLRMPFGCGEQNMILFAPNVFVARYLQETGQSKPEVMAKAESLMMTGYQRELIYRRADGSYSAFGDQDKEGSLWLTAFVMKTFAQAKGLIFIDDTVQDSAKAWILKRQNTDGSFDTFGFVIHQELVGGLQGKTALTAYLAIALQETGERTASAKAIAYLERQLDTINDAYTLALTAYALELAHSPKASRAYDHLMGMAHESDEGLSWGQNNRPLPQPQSGPPAPQAPIRPPQPRQNSAVVETTSYALVALVEHGDRLNASRAARWLVSQRNAFGGFESTQDTVVGLQALTRYAAGAKSDVDATITLQVGDWQKEVRVSPANADVLQMIEVPHEGQLRVAVKGKGQVVLQTVRRFNVPDAEKQAQSVFQMDVTYDAAKIEVNDQVTVTAKVKFTPPEPVKAGMVVLDVAIPTGFAPVTASLDKLVAAQPNLKRYEVAGRKVVLYIEDMLPGDQIQLRFQAVALYPVKAQPVTSQAYAYYRPEWKGESQSRPLSVTAQ
ncbi:MAG: alpha-2-macroglobulin [Chloroflexi bacterium]|nr:alpha-2-macroglobulin [Chloroflexota bacterium]